MIDREHALKIVREHVQNENLVRHMLAVEAAMRFYANQMGEDQERWGITALLHDFDWDIFYESAGGLDYYDVAFCHHVPPKV